MWKQKVFSYKTKYSHSCIVLIKVSSTNEAIRLYTCLIFQPIVSNLMCFFDDVVSFPFCQKLMSNSSSHTSYMRGCFPYMFSYLKLSFFCLSFMPYLHNCLVKAVMRSNVVVFFLNNLQDVFSGYLYYLC